MNTYTPFHFHAHDCSLSTHDAAQEIADAVGRLWDTQLCRFFATLWPDEPEKHAEELMQHGKWIISQYGREKSFSWKGEIIFSGDFESERSFRYIITPHTPPSKPSEL